MIVLLGQVGDAVNTLRLRQNGRHFADGILKSISLNENFWILNKISLKYVAWGFNWQYGSIGSDNGLAPSRQVHMLFGLNQLMFSGVYNRNLWNQPVEMHLQVQVKVD